MSTHKIRWWPIGAIFILAGAYTAWVWLREAPSQQVRVIMTFPAIFGTVLLLVLWLLFFSRLPGRLRWKHFGGFALVVALFLSLFHIEGVSGNLVPILRPRWEGARDFGAQATAAGVTAPGPGDYPQFQGPRRNAHLEGVRLARDWTAQPPRELWRHDVGEGWSSFAVVGDAAITQELRGNEEVVVRYKLETGESVWTHAYEAPFNTTIGGNGPRATPTIADGRVYTLGATGVLSALDLGDGSLLWSRQTVEENGAKVPDWGISCSPLVVGEHVVVQPGLAESKSLVAYDLATGEPVWTADAGSRGSYSSPLLVTLAGREQILMVNQKNVSGHDPLSGETLWKGDWPGENAKAATPLILADDTLLVSAGYGVGSRLFRLRDDQGGETLTADLVWESRRLKSKYASMVLHEGYVYGLDDGILVCIDPKTGERCWKRGRYGHGQIILVGGLLLIQTEKGAVVLVEPNPEEHRELARLDALDEKTWNPPALSGRYLLVRNSREAACYELPLEG